MCFRFVCLLLLFCFLLLLFCFWFSLVCFCVVVFLFFVFSLFFACLFLLAAAVAIHFFNFFKNETHLMIQIRSLFLLRVIP